MGSWKERLRSARTTSLTETGRRPSFSFGPVGRSRALPHIEAAGPRVRVVEGSRSKLPDPETFDPDAVRQNTPVTGAPADERRKLTVCITTKPQAVYATINVCRGPRDSLGLPEWNVSRDWPF